MANGHSVRGQGLNGHATNGRLVNGHGLNGAPPPVPDDYLEGWFRKKREHGPQPSHYQPQAREYSSREREYRQPGDDYPAPGRSILGFNPPAGSRAGQRHRVRNGMLIGLGCLIVVIGIGTGLTGGKFPSPPAALTYRVTGTPGVAVTYGPAGRTVTRQGPMHVTTTLGSALYYSITARLPGSGSVTCEILIGSALISKSVASGGHSVAACRISQNPSSVKRQDAGGG